MTLPQLEDYTAFKDRLEYSLSRSSLLLDNFRTLSLRSNIALDTVPNVQLLQELVLDSTYPLGVNTLFAADMSCR